MISRNLKRCMGSDEVVLMASLLGLSLWSMYCTLSCWCGQAALSVSGLISLFAIVVTEYSTMDTK